LYTSLVKFVMACFRINFDSLYSNRKVVVFIKCS
jgi:hypothetical protein